MNFTMDDIFTLTGAIWQSMLGMEITPDTSADAAATNRPRSTGACVQITGAWNGAVLLDCPTELARQCAAIMFKTNPADVPVTDMQDAVAELVNMIGGNIKALLPETCYLSLPAVVEGGDYSARVPGGAPIGRIVFSCQGQQAAIVLVEKVIQSSVAA